MAIPLDQFLKIPHRIGVAAGVAKAAAISAALQGGFINVIVMDSLAAEGIVNDKSTGELDRGPTWSRSVEVQT